jgi:hypothetical protein
MISGAETAIIATSLLVGATATLTWTELALMERPGRRRRLAIGLVCAGVSALICAWSALRIVPLVLIAVAALCSAYRDGPLRDGADDMLMVSSVGAAVASLPVADWTKVMALAFVAGQLLLSYLIAGAAKLAGSDWRHGSAVVDVLATRDFGRTVPRLLQGAGPAGRLASWGTIVLELTLPVMFVMGGPLLLPAVALGAMFHLGIATMLGLNRFLPAFLSAYPAAIFCTVHFGIFG